METSTRLSRLHAKLRAQSGFVGMSDEGNRIVIFVTSTKEAPWCTQYDQGSFDDVPTVVYEVGSIAALNVGDLLNDKT